MACGTYWVGQKVCLGFYHNVLWKIRCDGEAQYFGHLIRRANSLEKMLMLGKIEGKR